MNQLYKVRISPGLEYECLGDEGLCLVPGQQVVIRCERYLDYATVYEATGRQVEDVEAFERQRAQQSRGRHIEGQKVPQVMRVATEEDRAQAAENDARAREAHVATMERIRAHGLEMKLIYTHYVFDRKLIIFQFSADGRIDFRELLRDLSGLLKARVELRQVGVRDEASILGGIGTCGRPLCCASFLPSFNSINVKMAKQQGLSLNPQNISGCCGRLKCCLQYEAEAYREMTAELKLRQQAAALSAEKECQAAAEKAGDVSEAPSEPDLFDGEGTIVTARSIVVPSAATPRQEGAPPRRRERGQGGQGAKSERGAGQPPRRGGEGAPRPGGASSARPGGGRPQGNPQKHPLPPPGADARVDGTLPAGGAPTAPRGERRRGPGGERRREPRPERPEGGEGAPSPRPERSSRPRGGGEGAVVRPEGGEGTPSPRPSGGEA